MHTRSKVHPQVILYNFNMYCTGFQHASAIQATLKQRTIAQQYLLTSSLHPGSVKLCIAYYLTSHLPFCILLCAQSFVFCFTLSSIHFITILIFFFLYHYSISVDLETASSTSAIILLVLWCHRLCLQEENIPQSETSIDIKNVPQNDEDKFLPRSTSLDDNDIPFFFQLKTCLLKIQNNFQSLEKLLNSNRKEFVINENYDDTDDMKIEDNENIRKILKIFSELWNVNTLGPGSALISLHCLRKKVEESTKISLKSNDIDKNENNEKIENQRNMQVDVAAAVHALLDTIETLPTTRHPRLYFIISWLLTSTSAEHSSEHSLAITEDPFLSSNFMSKNVLKNCSVMNLFLLNPTNDNDNDNNNDGGEYFTVNLPILPVVFGWLDSRVNDILTFRSSDVLDSDALLTKGRALTSLIAKVSIVFPFLIFLILLSSYQLFLYQFLLFNSISSFRSAYFLSPFIPLLSLTTYLTLSPFFSAFILSSIHPTLSPSLIMRPSQMKCSLHPSSSVCLILAILIDTLFSSLLLMQWLSSSVNDILNSLKPSDDAIAKASETAIVDIVDWFDVKLANLFSTSTTIDSTKKSKFPLLGSRMIASVTESMFPNDSSVKKAGLSSSDNCITEKKDIVTPFIHYNNKAYSVLLARKFESIAQVRFKLI